MSQPGLFDDQGDDQGGKVDAWRQQFDLMRKCLAMQAVDCPEWVEFLELVKAMRDAQRTAEFGVAYSKIKRDRAERAVDAVLREFEEMAKPLPGGPIDFTREPDDPAKGGCA